MNKFYRIMASTIMLSIVLTGYSKTKVANDPKNGVQGVPATQLTNETAKDKTYKYFATPDKIIFYNHGIEKDIEKGSSLFNNILDLTDKRFNDRIGFYKSEIDVEGLNKMQQSELMLVFSYSDIKETTYLSQTNTIKKYKRLIMPLSGNTSNFLYFDDGGKYSSGPIGTLSPPDGLVNLLK